MISITPARQPKSCFALKNLLCVSLCFLLEYGPMTAQAAPVISGHNSLIRLFNTCTPPTPEQLKAYKEAATAVRSMLEKMNPAKADTEALNNALKKVALDDDTIGKFEVVAQTLEAGVSSKTGRFVILKQLTTDLTDKVNVLNKAVIPFDACKDEPTPEVKEVLADFKIITGQVPDSLKTSDKLQEAVKSIPEKVQTVVELIAAKTQGAISLPANLAPQTLRSELAATLPDLAVALRSRRQFAATANRIAQDLDPAAHDDLKGIIPAKPEFSFAKVDAQLQPALAKVGPWAHQAAEVARDEEAKAEDTLFKAMRDPFHQSTEALAVSTLAEKQGRDVTTIANAFVQLLSEMQKEEVPANILPPDFAERKARELSDATEILQLMSARLARVAVQLSGDIAVDKSTWSMASVDLFYFDNVDRLMHVLSQNVRSIGGRQDFQTEARLQRRALDEASQTLADAEASVSDSRQEVANLRERVRQATVRRTSAVERQRAEISDIRRTADTAEARERGASLRLKRIDARKTLAQSRLSRAQEAANAKPDDPDLQKRVTLTQQEVDQLTLQSDDAKAEQEKAHDEATNARTQANSPTTDVDQELEELNGELAKAQAALDSALTARSAATAAHRAAMRSAFLAAEAENFAFAQARDNLPFLTNLPEPKAPGAEDGSDSDRKTPGPFIDTDPINRVLLFAFPDSRTIFIRGAQDDIDLVRQIIKEFDHPSGQALMTLRTIELNSDGSRDSAKRTLAFLQIMDDELGHAQHQVEQALSDLRTLINAQVSVATQEYERQLQTKINALPRDNPQRDLAILQLTRHEENQTLGFYDRRVLVALGWPEDSLARTIDTSFLNSVIPPPAQTVNLAQALIVLSLASTENRCAIVRQLRAPYFASLVRFLGTEGDSADVVGFQARLVEALRFNGITHVLEVAVAKARLKLTLEQEQEKLRTDLEVLGRQFEPLDRERGEVDTELEQVRNDLRTATGDRRAALQKHADELQNRQAGLIRRIAALRSQAEQIREPLFAADGSLQVVKRDLSATLSWLQGNATGISPDFLQKRIEQAIASNDDTSALVKQALGYRRSARFRFSQASESAVNLTFRKYLEQVNRDLTDLIIKPTFRRLNQRLIEAHLGVGVIQETSILASNRFVARVDPKGSAQLAVGEERNALEAAKQFANLLGLARPGFLTGSVAPLAGGPLGAGSSLLNTATGVLNALDEMPREAAPEVYGIATGNVFQVTPVIDPSGQSLRFKFDFLSATQIREPNDTINPQLPRIERHSINTEVQLADQEIRLISQFQANSRLGIAKRKSGGFPILKDIPGVSEVPLLGWFVKRGGRSAQTQQSFVFCQTTMYPTLSEVLDAAVRSPSFTGLETP